MYFSSSEALRNSPVASRSHHGQVWKEARQGREGQDSAQDLHEAGKEAKEEEGRNQVGRAKTNMNCVHRPIMFSCRLAKGLNETKVDVAGLIRTIAVRGQDVGEDKG